MGRRKKVYTLKDFKRGTTVAGDTKEKLRKQLTKYYPNYKYEIKTIIPADGRKGFAGIYYVKFKKRKREN